MFRFAPTLVVTLLLAAFALSPSAASRPESAVERVFDAQGHLVAERGPVAGAAGLMFERHYFRQAEDPAKPPWAGGGSGSGGGNGGGDGGGGGLTDCTATNYRAGGWSWSTPWSATASAFVAEFAAAGAAWQAETSAPIFAGVTFGNTATAGTYDGVNQIDFANLGSGGTIAVTTTWYYRGSGEAVESDAQYNTYYAWATDGSSGAMDVLNIATHETGHTFGLDHPKGQEGKIGCLTMYAYGAYGETDKRTLGDGDILGLRALYGA